MLFTLIGDIWKLRLPALFGLFDKKTLYVPLEIIVGADTKYLPPNLSGLSAVLLAKRRD